MYDRCLACKIKVKTIINVKLPYHRRLLFGSNLDGTLAYLLDLHKCQFVSVVANPETKINISIIIT